MTNTMITTIQVYDLADLGKQPANEYPQVKLATTEVDMLSLSEMLGGAIIIGAQRRKELMAERKKRMKERRKREEAFGRAHDWAAIEKALKEERKGRCHPQGDNGMLDEGTECSGKCYGGEIQGASLRDIPLQAQMYGRNEMR